MSCELAKHVFVSDGDVENANNRFISQRSCCDHRDGDGDPVHYNPGPEIRQTRCQQRRLPPLAVCIIPRSAGEQRLFVLHRQPIPGDPGEHHLDHRNGDKHQHRKYLPTP